VTALATVLAAALAVASCARRPATHELSVAAATSLREAMPALVTAYERAHRGTHMTVTYGASGALAAQIEAGAPVDAVFFAGATPLDALVAKGRVDAASRRVVASNVLVLAGAPAEAGLSFATLGTIPAGERVAVGDPASVPAGEYARDYLRALGSWESLQPSLVFAPNVAAVLAYARRGEARAAIVYRTELRGVNGLVELDEATGPRAPRPSVVAGVVRDASPDAAQFVAFVASADGASVLASSGFGPP
jgi:molybdate transport system substrate-binding protein